MATSSNNPAFQGRNERYGLGRTGAPVPAQNTFSTPATGFGSNARTSQQKQEAERLERERRAREDRERMEQAGQDSLAGLTEEQREEIDEAVSNNPS